MGTVRKNTGRAAARRAGGSAKGETGAKSAGQMEERAKSPNPTLTVAGLPLSTGFGPRPAPASPQGTALRTPQARKHGGATHTPRGGQSGRALPTTGLEGQTFGATALAVAPQLEPTAAELVANAAHQWSEELAAAVETCGLDDLRGLGGCFLEFTTAHPSGLVQLLSRRPTKLSSLFREREAYFHAVNRAEAVCAQMGKFASEYGTASLSLAIGVVSWTEPIASELFAPEPEHVPSDDDDFIALAHAVTPAPAQAYKPAPYENQMPGAEAEVRESARPRGYGKKTIQMPVLLHPVTIKPLTLGDYEIQLDGTPIVNPALARILRRKGALLDPVALAESCSLVSGFRPHEVLDRISALGEAVIPHFGLLRRTLAGNFINPRQAIVNDFTELQDNLAKHELIQALAGDQKAARALSSVELPEATADTTPLQERGVGDLNQSHQHVLSALPTGANLFVNAPLDAEPGKMAAAIVAEAAAAGRSVLYVAGQRRATGVLKSALSAVDLDELLLEIPPTATWRDDVSHRLLGAMSLADSPEMSSTLVHDALIGVRTQLTGYMSGLHRKHAPWGVSAYEALQVLAQLTSGPESPTTTERLAPQVLQALTAANRAKAAHDLGVAAQLGAFTPEVASSRWYGATVANQAEVVAALSRVRRLVESSLPGLMSQAAYIAESTGLRLACTINEFGEQLQMLAGMRGTLDVFLPMVFERSVRDLIMATTPRKQRDTNSDEFEMGILASRRLRKHAKGMVRPGVKVTDLTGALEKVEAQREIWAVHAVRPGWPVLPDGLAAIEGAFEGVLFDLKALEPVLSTASGMGPGLADMQLPELLNRLAALADDVDTLEGLPEREDCLRRIRINGLGALISDFTARQVGAEQVRAELELAWWGSVFEQMIKADPNLAGYDGRSLAELVTRFSELDRQHVSALSHRVRNKVAAQLRALDGGKASPSASPFSPVLGGGLSSSARDELQDLYAGLMSGEFQSVRQLVENHGRLVKKLRPVFVATPTLVPHLLPTKRCVDLVVLEAIEELDLSQLVPTLARGTQIVVIGDANAASGSALPALQAVMPNLNLAAPVSQRDPEVSRLLQQHGYEEIITLAPMPRGFAALTFEKVVGRGMVDATSGLVDSTTEELATVAGLVLNHAKTRPNESLAIVTLTKKHADAISSALVTAAKSDPTLATYFGPTSTEPVAVVPATEVSGLRRDALIFSLGLGCTPHGKVLHNFGPLSESGGAEVLNAILAVARRRIMVVSCFGAGDLDRDRMQAGGPAYLYKFLELAEARTGKPWQLPRHSQAALHIVADETDSAPAESKPNVLCKDRLLADIGERLQRQGYLVEYNYGFDDGPKIPMAVGHSDLPSELLVAVHGDGPDYLEEDSLRARDRHRTEQLTKMGWAVTQVFSVAAFLDPEGETERIRRLVHIAKANRMTSRADTAPVPAVANPVASIAPQVQAETEMPVEGAAVPVRRRAIRTGTEKVAIFGLGADESHDFESNDRHLVENIPPHHGA